MPSLAESTAEWIAGIIVAIVLALITGFGTAYGLFKNAIREQRVKDAEADRNERKADAAANLEEVQKENSMWYNECQRLIAIHAEDRKRWLEDARDLRDMVEAAEKSYKGHIDRCETDVAKLKADVVRLEGELIRSYNSGGDKK